MREIKFRAWHHKTKQYLHGLGFDPEGTLPRCVYGDGVDPLCMVFMSDVVMEQYTGLKDKNGKEIYEGDIVKTVVGSGVVVFGNYEIGRDDWGLIHSTPGFVVEWPKKSKHEETGYSQLECGYVVVGNIHENKELLK